jgi:large subunit ribosomal protein L16
MGPVALLIRGKTMHGLLSRTAPIRVAPRTLVPRAGIKNWAIPNLFKDVEFPERAKLKFVDKVPTYPTNLRPPKMQKNLIFMRGPELIHNKFIHKQYGIVSQGPGRLRYGHFEMMRLTIGRLMDTTRMFAIWRIDPPWQPITKKGQGKRMGGGKGAIDHYITPIKHGRVIIEMGGSVDFAEIKPIFKQVIDRLPFPAIGVTNEELEQREIDKKVKEESNMNPYTFKYVIKNNMGGVQDWISPYDRKWFGEHR